MQRRLWRQPRNRPIPLTCSVVRQMMATFRNFTTCKKSRFELKRGKKVQCVSNRCKDLFEHKKYFRVSCTLIYQSSIISQILDFVHWMVTSFSFDHITDEDWELMIWRVHSPPRWLHCLKKQKGKRCCRVECSFFLFNVYCICHVKRASVPW